MPKENFEFVRETPELTRIREDLNKSFQKFDLEIVACRIERVFCYAVHGSSFLSQRPPDADSSYFPFLLINEEGKPLILRIQQELGTENRESILNDKQKIEVSLRALLLVAKKVFGLAPKKIFFETGRLEEKSSLKRNVEELVEKMRKIEDIEIVNSLKIPLY